MIGDIPGIKEEEKFIESTNQRDTEKIVAEFIQTGENRLFETLVRRYKDRVFRLVVSILGPFHAIEAEDVTQEVFVKTYLQLSHFSFKSQFGTWLYRITYNTAVDYKRKARNFLIRSSENAIDRIKAEKAEDDPFKTIVNMERCETVLASMQELPDIYRSVLYLYYWLGYSIREIAEHLGISPETIKTHLHRGRHKLYRKMKQKGITYEE